MKKLTVISQKVSLVVAFVGLICISAMMIYTTIDLIARYFFGKAITGVIEVVSFMFCLTLYAGLAFCQTRHSHIHITMFVTKFHGKIKFFVWGLTSLVSFATGVTVTIASFIQSGVSKAQGMHSTLLWIPYYPFYFFGAICMGLFSLCVLLDCIKAFLAVFKPEYADEVASNWVS